MADEPDPLAVDWCAYAVKLQKVEMALLTGEMVTEARFGTDMMRYADASLKEVQQALEKAMTNCRISRGETPRRLRFPARGIMRPY